MECSEPGVIRDEELIAYLVGEKVRPAVEQHLARCQRCTSLLASYRRMDSMLASKLYRWSCPSNMELGEYQLGLLIGAQAAAVRQHLSQCALCAADMETLAQFLAQDALVPEPDPLLSQQTTVQLSANNNRQLVKEAKQALEQWADQSHTGIQRLVAILLPQQPRTAFLRDTARPDSSWPRSYEAGDIQLNLQIERGAGREGALQLIGFVVQRGTPLEALQGTPVQLFSSEQMIYSQKIDELGNFVFPSLVPATYTLELHLPGCVVVIDQLTITTQD